MGSPSIIAMMCIVHSETTPIYLRARPRLASHIPKLLIHPSQTLEAPRFSQCHVFCFLRVSVANSLDWNAAFGYRDRPDHHDRARNSRAQKLF
jgi:hypothetical protein